MRTRTMIPKDIAYSQMVQACLDGRYTDGDGDDPSPQTKTDSKARQKN